MREQVSETPFHRFPFYPSNISLRRLAQCLTWLACPSLTGHTARRLRLKTAFCFSFRGKCATQRKTCKWDQVACAQEARRAHLEVVQNLCRYFPLVCIDLLLSSSKQQRDAGEVGVGGGGWAVPLWETFVTSVTAPLDGWAASIWLQCM